MKLCASSQFPFVCLGDCGEVVTGSTPPKANSDFWGGEIPFVTPAQLGFQPPITTADEYVTSEGADRGRLLPEGAVLVCCIGSLGKTGTAGVPLISNQQINAIIFDPIQVDARYGYHAACSLTPLLKHFAPSTTVKIVKKSAFAEFQIPLPPLDEQQRIAGILDAADALRAKRREALAQLDTFLQSTFLDTFGDPVTNPMGWVETPFGDITTDTKLGLVRSSKEFGWDFGIPYVRMDAVTGDGYFLPDKVQSTHADEEEVEVFALRPGDFLFNTRNSKELVGKVCVFPGPEGWLFNNNLMRVRFRADVEPWVIAMQFRFRRVQRELEKRKSGTTSVFAVYWKSLQTLPVLVPPLYLQHRFGTLLESVEQQKARQCAHLAELDTLFASLQSRAFRGDL